MEVVENLAQWQTGFEVGWLAHLDQTGETDWSIYPKIKNQSAPSGKRVDLAQSRLLLISTAGGYLQTSQTPYDAASLLGDYSIRRFPVSTSFDELAFAHDHYDHTSVTEDAQVLLPLRHLAAMVDEGTIGELAENVVSYSGYQPNVTRILNETAPAVLEAVRAEQANAVLLVPA